VRSARGARSSLAESEPAPTSGPEASANVEPLRVGAQSDPAVECDAVVAETAALRKSVDDRDEWIHDAEAEHSRIMGSRLLRLRHTLVEPWSPRKPIHVARSVASLLFPRSVKRGARTVRETWRNPPPTASPTVLDERFDPDLYRALYWDVEESGSDPLEHYLAYGKSEGRVGWLDLTQDLTSLEPGRPTALVVFHDGSRTGAPILGFNLVRRLLGDRNVVALFYKPGPIMAACRAAGALVVGPEVVPGGRLPTTTSVFRHIVEWIDPQFAILNSVESRQIARALAELYVPTISLIHEFSAYTRPLGAVTHTAFWSGETVFSTDLTRDNARAMDPPLSGIDFPVIPQGRCDLPEADGVDPCRSQEEAALVERTLRPPSFPSDGIVILGIGTVQPRKGVDLFVECATRVRELAPDLPARFVWIGTFDPESDPQYAGLLADQISRADLAGSVAILNDVADLLPAYQTADMLMVSSRLDPLPNVAIDALSEGLPVLCFDRATGIADVLTQNGLGDACVASYLSPESMARKVIELAGSADLRRRVGSESARIAAATFDMNRYFSRLEGLLEQEKTRAAREHRDAETIAASGLLRFDFAYAPEPYPEPASNVVRRYVRAWSSRIYRRKPFPGFHPGIYLADHGVDQPGEDPLADYIRAGRPPGPWDFRVLTPTASPSAVAGNLRIGLHVHVHYPELLAGILERLTDNETDIDLLISATSEQSREAAISQLANYQGGAVDVRLVPNRGRDIGPLLTEFADTITAQYDVIGHVHTKKTADVADTAVGEGWYRFLLENLLGGQARMADEILSRMSAEPDVGMVFPDDPHVIGWTANRAGAEALSLRMQLGRLPENPVFPMGSMFWARVLALRPLFDLGLTWDDYPEEPLPYDGTILHAIERVLPMVATASGSTILLSNVPGVTR
jgi:glycosyltransferase involved in cell wall biosynthesis